MTAIGCPKAAEYVHRVHEIMMSSEGNRGGGWREERGGYREEEGEKIEEEKGGKGGMRKESGEKIEEG